jgi:hypothetical protein
MFFYHGLNLLNREKVNVNNKDSDPKKNGSFIIAGIVICSIIYIIFIIIFFGSRLSETNSNKYIEMAPIIVVLFIIGFICITFIKLAHVQEKTFNNGVLRSKQTKIVGEKFANQDFEGAIKDLEFILGEISESNKKKRKEVLVYIDICKKNEGIQKALRNNVILKDSGNLEESGKVLYSVMKQINAYRRSYNSDLVQEVEAELNEINRIIKEEIIQKTNKEMEELSKFLIQNDFDGANNFLAAVLKKIQKYKFTGLTTQLIKKQKSIKQFEQLHSLFNISNKVKLKHVERIFDLDRGQLLNSIKIWQKTLKDLKIKGDFLTMDNLGDLGSLLDKLDSQFSNWKVNEKTKEGKIEDGNFIIPF